MIFEPQAKLLRHTSRVREWIDTGRTHPILVEIAPTGYCNAHCPWCFFKDKRSNEKIGIPIMLRALNELSELGVRAINWTGGGEPTLHPGFGLFVNFAHELGLKQGLFTNGFNTVPEQRKFSWIRISLTDEGFQRIKKPGVPFGICLNQTEVQSNQDLEELCLEAKRLGAKYFQVRPALSRSFKGQPVLEVPRFLEKFRDETFEVYVTPYKYEEALKPKGYAHCYGYHFCPSLDWLGNFGACLYLMHDPNYVFGNVNEESLVSIWGKLEGSVRVTDRCQNCCKNHEINKILDASRNVKDECFL